MLYLHKHYTHLQNKCFLISLFFFLNLNICYLYSNECIYFLIQPLLHLKTVDYLIVTEITEIFILQLFIAFIFSLFFTAGYFILQLSLFFIRGCYKLENIQLLRGFSFFLLTFYLNNYIIFKYLIPMICTFFIEIPQSSQQFFFEPKLSNYIFLIIKTTVLSNLLLQYPFLIGYLLMTNNCKIKWLIDYRKIFYLKIWLLTTFLSPPDIFTPALISFLLILFLEINISLSVYWNLLNRILFKKRRSIL